MRSMNQLSLSEKRVLIREDLNVPIRDGKVANDARLRAAVPSIKAAVDAGGRVIVMSHLGRPTEGEFDAQYSLAPVAGALSELMQMPVRLQSDWPSGAPESGEIWLLENVRFNEGEKSNADDLAKRYAALCDVFVMDALARRIVHKHPPTVWRNLLLRPVLGHFSLESSRHWPEP